MKIFDNDKLSQESDNLLQVLDYNPKTILNEKDIMDHIPIIKLKSSKIEKSPYKYKKNNNTNYQNKNKKNTNNNSTNNSNNNIKNINNEIKEVKE